ncbi:TetR/AcrR family transcriptional regulator [Pelosinus fermentans]|uniref:Transcriptional regulator, TetR family n=1 Tax=Pelosinus fermentans JBW45 TaxID=1192197 RepID=I8TPK4_9FIRM|nr:TetR family transcriptional regulator [Pelosinus fermentans]AJQ29563.1 transcriptional regulator, TetR family [Pelosinus fermentans JBW45]
MEYSTADKIMETAIPLFAKKGYVAVSIREVADAVQINSSAISYYFKSKEGLYQAALEANFSPVDKLLKSVETMNDLNAIELLTIYAQNIVKLHRKHPFLARFVNSELANPTPCGEKIIKKYISQLYQFVHSSLCKGVAAGDFAPDLNLSYAAVSLAGILNFYFLTTPVIKEFIVFSECSDEEYISQAIRIYLNGISIKK